MTSIFLRLDGGLVEMTEQPYEAESVLQQLLAQFPELLAGAGAGECGELLLVEREVGVADAEGASGRWSLDHLFVDREAIPTLVEVKRSSDTRPRREWVGQMLDYAANAAAYWDVADLRAQFEQRHADGDAALAAMRDVLGDGWETDADAYWERVDSNLRAGRLRLVFVADAIPRELRRIVEFLNEQMVRAEVLAIEVKQYADAAGDHHTLVPQLIGDTARSEQAKGGSSGRRRAGKLDQATLFEAIREQQEPALAARLERLYGALAPRADKIVWSHASGTLWLGDNADPAHANPLSVAFWGNASTDGAASVNFVHFVGKRAPREVHALANELATLPGMEQLVHELAAKDYKSWLSLGPALADDASAARLADVLLAGAIRTPEA